MPLPESTTNIPVIFYSVLQNKSYIQILSIISNPTWKSSNISSLLSPDIKLQLSQQRRTEP